MTFGDRPARHRQRRLRDRPAVRGVVAATVGTLLAVTGCGAGNGDTVAAACLPAVTVTAPAADAVLGAGPVTLAGTTTTGDSTVLWSVRDGGGTEISTGSTAEVAGDGTFTVPLALAEGSYSAALWAVTGSDTAAGGCPVTTQALQVAAGGAPRWGAGASGAGVPDGSFAAWRGSPVTIAGTWANTAAGQLKLWPLHGEYAGWTGDLEIAIGAIEKEETWAQAAQGAYDQRWTQSLQEAARLWAGRPGTLYLRFAHEFNGDWYPWSVTPASLADFKTGWQRFRALQQQHFPAAKLVFSPNSETMDEFGMDWRQAFPGPGQVDVISTTYYNSWFFTDTVDGFRHRALDYNAWGGPRGPQRFLEFARSVGLPLALSEWGVYAPHGDSTTWMEQMYGFLNANAGSGPGQVLYEIFFNEVQDNNGFAVFPDTKVPNSAATYCRLW
ncbi:Gmad2 immunoglobulin-like domain-containing protein [Modestobacter marinus]|uniref:Gmad2 immunoglobulin-like domain-containing protein n=1 Tax=Modestobacter marinus TaxID=477641 RepID=UPI001C9678E4|nr:Gmad2 immunoglobulin-like domain-containing protein [Modestobacter marinus]